MEKTRQMGGLGPTALVAGIAFVPALVLGASGAGSYSNSWAIAVVMIASGVLCTVAAAIALSVSLRLGFVENALVAAALTGSGALVLSHGLLSPGAIFDDTMTSFGASGQLSAVAVIPPLGYLALRRRQLDQSQSWRAMSVLVPAAAAVVAVSLLLASPFEPLKPKTFEVSVLVVVAVGVQVVVALHFAGLARRFADVYSQRLSMALLLNSAIPVFFYFGGPGSGAYWWAHGLCMVAVAVASLAIWRRAQDASVASHLVGTLLTTKPMQTLEVDIAPSVAARLRSISEHDDPRLLTALETGRALAGMQAEQNLGLETLLPIFRSTLESLEPQSAAT